MTLNDVRLPSLHFSWKEAPSSTSLAGGLEKTALGNLSFLRLCNDPRATWNFFNQTTGRRTLLEHLETPEYAHWGLKW